MPSSGTAATGFCVGLGPYNCVNCQKKQGDFCKDNDVNKDPDVDASRKKPEGVLVGDVAEEICCNEFLSKKDPQRWDGKSKMRSIPQGVANGMADRLKQAVNERKK